MNNIGTSAGTLKLLGGRLSLDFANTADWHATGHPIEFLTSYSELVAWSRHVSVLTESEAQHLLEEAVRRPAEASAVLARTIALREAVYRLFSAISHGLSPQADDLSTFNAELSTGLAQSRIVLTAEGFVWDWLGDQDALDQMLWPVVHDAAELLTSEKLHRVGQCVDDRCGWLFLDLSRNRSRRWCSMEACGNRAKARRHYRRSQDSQKTGS
jgi:predicted RNA-binding Zn ribbon-like protein